MEDPLCLLYYPMRRECYWWSIVMLLRPTVIAITFNSRNRGTGLIQELVDWRVMVIFFRPGPLGAIKTSCTYPSSYWLP
jgi:hypothetical protein